MYSKAKTGFTYVVEHIRDGKVLSSEECHNIMPEQGLAYLMGAGVLGAQQRSAWYIGLNEGAYTPSSADVMATYPGLASEAADFTEGQRQTFVGAGTTVVTNIGNEVYFTKSGTGTATIYGGFISSSQAFNATSGVLLSAVRFSNPKVMAVGDQLKVTAGVALIGD